MAKEFEIEKLKGSENDHSWQFTITNWLSQKGWSDTIIPEADDETKALEETTSKLNSAGIARIKSRSSIV